MIFSTIQRLALVCLSFSFFVSAQRGSSSTRRSSSVTPSRSVSNSPSATYTGYTRTTTGNFPTGVDYETDATGFNNSYPPPDVFLNASVSVSEIDLIVSNISAKINLDAQVLQLLQLNAGVDASIDRVSLVIKEVEARVLLEARLGNLLNMIEDVLHSLDLNPILATLGNDVSKIVNTTVGTLTGGLQERSFEIEQNILYSVNDYNGNTHTNRILAQNGNIIEQSLTNDGKSVGSSKVVGNYKDDMTFLGHNKTIEKNGEQLYELQYEYKPFLGLDVVSYIYENTFGDVVETQVLSEVEGGGTYTVGGSQELKQK
jgi:hypothetical protein